MARKIDEFDLIARYFAPLTLDMPGAHGLLDDVATLWVPEGHELVISADTLVAGIHCPETTAPVDIARRALRVNLSDIAAKGATPLAYTMTLALPENVEESWVQAYASGLASDQATYGIGLLGGDTTRTRGPLTISINIFGQVYDNKWIKRSDAQVDDDVYVSGSIGDSFLGLALEQGHFTAESQADHDFLVDRFLRPQPRVQLGQGLVGHASGAADVSDGLVADLGHVCKASGLAAELDLSAVPISDAALRAVTDNQQLRLKLLCSGDDYEIVFTAPKSERDALLAISREVGVPMARIGRTVTYTSGAKRVVVRDEAGKELELGDGGYRHFETEGSC